jgi:excisionase family DNA binding protein
MHKRKEKKPGHEVQQLLLTVAQAAVVLGVHRSTVYDLIKYEGLPMVSLGGRRGTRILLTSLHQWMKGRESCSLP